MQDNDLEREFAVHRTEGDYDAAEVRHRMASVLGSILCSSLVSALLCTSGRDLRLSLLACAISVKHWLEALNRR